MMVERLDEILTKINRIEAMLATLVAALGQEDEEEAPEIVQDLDGNQGYADRDETHEL